MNTRTCSRRRRSRPQNHLEQIRPAPTGPYSAPRQAISRRMAFTLVELLVVIAIIMVLIAIFLPTINVVREQARTIKCLANLRQIGLATYAYAADHKGHVYHTESRGGFWGFLLVNNKYLSASIQAFSVDGPNSSDSVFRCPSGLDTPWPGGGLTCRPDDPLYAMPYRYRVPRSGDPPGIDSGCIDVWYAINSSNGNYSDPEGDFRKVPFRMPGATTSDKDTCYRDNRTHELSDFKNPSELVLFADGVLWCRRSQCISARHTRGKSANFLLADGHVENIHRDLWPKNYQEGNDNIGYPKFCLEP